MVALPETAAATRSRATRTLHSTLAGSVRPHDEFARPEESKEPSRLVAATTRFIIESDGRRMSQCGRAIAASCVATLCLFLIDCSASAGGSKAARGGPVYPGCAAPTSAPKHIYYSDPVSGSMTSDGSQAHPWGSLSAIVAAGKLPPAATAVVAPGDALYLLSGDHGSLNIDNGFNSDFIVVQAAPGQHPTLSGITMYGGSHWMFNGLTIQNLNNGGYVFGARLDADDVIFTGSTVLSQPDVSRWTQAEWQQGAIAGVNASGNCVAITNNMIQNVGSAIGVSGSNILVRGNSVDHFGDDGIDFGQGTDTGTISNLEISGNTLTNNLDIGDGNHNDGIQGWVLNGTTGTNVLIDSNSVISQTDPSLPWPGNMQGISEFDGAWDNIHIINNVVVAAAYHGISIYGAHDSTIINNTVFGNFVATNGDVNDTWIGVFSSKDGTPPVNVVVRNNISSVYSLADAGVTADHNVTATFPQSMFVKFDRTLFQYDLHPVPGSVELGFGSSLLAPGYDITGASRTSPITAGAYQ